MNIRPVSSVEAFRSHARRYASALAHDLDRLPWAALERAAEMILEAARAGRTIFLFGNGGGAATASHLACDLGKGASANGQAVFRARALGENLAWMTALANDCGFERVFVEELRTALEPGDVCVVFSTSGRSPNVVEAARYARGRGARVIAVCGDGGDLAGDSDVAVVLPAGHKGRIEDLQLVVAHILGYHFIENGS